MKYIDRLGKEYDIMHFNEKERELFDWMMEEYNNSELSWTQFQETTSQRLTDELKKLGYEKWRDHPLYHIHFDLVGNVGIRSGELSGDLSEMVID